MSSPVVTLVGGGSGGHLYPGLALAAALEQSGASSHFLRGGRAVEKAILDDSGHPVHEVLGFPRSPGAAIRCWRQVSRAFDEVGTSALVALGGAAGVMPTLVARSRKLPVFVLEQNRVIGRANRLIRKLARRTFLSFADTIGAPRRDMLRMGCPVRSSFQRRPLPEGQPQVLVLGGSQGAEPINTLISDALPELGHLAGQVRFLHLSGAGKGTELQARYAEQGIEARVLEYLDDPASVLAESSLVVARAGGSTIAELIAVGRGALLSPYPHHRDRQQFLNAEALVAVGGAEVIDESPGAFAARLGQIVLDRSLVAAWASASGSLAMPDPARRIAEVIATHLECAPTGAEIGVAS